MGELWLASSGDHRDNQAMSFYQLDNPSGVIQRLECKVGDTEIVELGSRAIAIHCSRESWYQVNFDDRRDLLLALMRLEGIEEDVIALVNLKQKTLETGCSHPFLTKLWGRTLERRGGICDDCGIAIE